MSKSASENYLDQLLNSVHDSEDHAQETQQPLNPQEKLEREIFGEPESNAQVTAKKEEEFLREFEEELLKDDMQEPFSDYKPKMIQEPEEVPTDTDLEVDTGDDLDFNFDFLSNQIDDSFRVKINSLPRRLIILRFFGDCTVFVQVFQNLSSGWGKFLSECFHQCWHCSRQQHCRNICNLNGLFFRLDVSVAPKEEFFRHIILFFRIVWVTIHCLSFIPSVETRSLP